MTIIYASGAMEDGDFNDCQKRATYHLNPSNQNFHYRFLKALSTKTKVEALTLRPFSQGLFKESEITLDHAQDEKISFTYLPDKIGRFYRYFSRHHKLVKLISQDIKKAGKDVIILVDSMKFALAKAAIRAAKKNKVKIFGIITDNPAMLSNESRLYAMSIKSLYSKYDGFIALTNGLDKLANKKNKPAYIFHGFAEAITPQKNLESKPYFFCCGALYERYGILNLIEAFHQVKTDNELLIAGHGPLIETIEAISKDDPRIRYLGLLSREEIHRYEQNADLNINPRIYDAELDKYSVPSKVLEYLASGTPLLSTMHTTLHDEFCGEAIWVKDGSVGELRKAMELFLQIKTEDMKKKALLAKEKVLAHYGLEIQGQKIYEFLTANSSFSKS
ncbi:MAG: glycosyltransferase [Bacilli bacterium]